MKIDFKKIQDIFSPKKTVSSGVFGLDIGTFSIKAAEVKKKWPQKKSQLTFSVLDIAEGSPKDTIVAAIRQCVESAGITSGGVNLSFSGTNIITRYMLMPKMAPKDLISSLEFELTKHIPGRLEDMVIDYQVLDKSLDNQMLILVVGAERRIIAERVEMVKQAGFTARSINVDCFAILEAFQHLNFASAKGNVPVALLDMGHKVTKLLVLEKNIVRFSRDIMLGGYELTRAISERMNMDLKSAEELKRNIQDKSSEASTIVNSNLNGILDEVRLSFDYCERLTQKKISRLYLSGGGARLKDIDEFFSSSLEVEISFWSPAGNFKLRNPALREEAEAKSSLLATAIGLAL
ncbi:MAG: type IV pilus assembly protein PilM [Candidatus Omnitrophota bacterium]|nr:type IV pilus assembly protein PilM [Candidatus Omnitrophota bacterium]